MHNTTSSVSRLILSKRVIENWPYHKYSRGSEREIRIASLIFIEIKAHFATNNLLHSEINSQLLMRSLRIINDRTEFNKGLIATTLSELSLGCKVKLDFIYKLATMSIITFSLKSLSHISLNFKCVTKNIMFHKCMTGG